MIGVIGATGNVGNGIVRKLVEAGEDVVAISRRGGQDTPRTRHVAADLARPEQLRDTLRGAQAVFLMVAGSGAGLDAHAIVSAIAESGARRIVLLSSIGTLSRPNAISHEPLRVLEAEVKRSGIGWTILQPGGFASNAMAWIAGVRAQRAVAAPFGDVGLPIVDPDDIASVAAVALRDERHAEALYTLTGPERITPREQARALGSAIGTPLDFLELSRGQAAEAWRAFMPETVVETTLDALGTPNDIERRVSPDMERVLGRPAQPFSAWAERNANVFR
ncbi:Oxidoreductase [Labilithrix luteola]|uniref:Oxidoreductase n=1 Tax=Labilithrix luteola TaxID=1391654 RepID=A0A0K1QDI9_9BACT|nr:NAD(P)H-binding protein [Labilithrix luteola]AKV03841.1 Oxidoreductase [Labilithrix luteola]